MFEAGIISGYVRVGANVAEKLLVQRARRKTDLYSLLC